MLLLNPPWLLHQCLVPFVLCGAMQLRSNKVADLEVGHLRWILLILICSLSERDYFDLQFEWKRFWVEGSWVIWWIDFRLPFWRKDGPLLTRDYAMLELEQLLLCCFFLGVVTGWGLACWWLRAPVVVVQAPTLVPAISARDFLALRHGFESSPHGCRTRRPGHSWGSSWLEWLPGSCLDCG